MKANTAVNAHNTLDHSEEGIIWWAAFNGACGDNHVIWYCDTCKGYYVLKSNGNLELLRTI